MDLLDEIQEVQDKEDQTKKDKAPAFDFNPTALLAGLLQKRDFDFSPPHCEDWIYRAKNNLKNDLFNKQIKKTTKNNSAEKLSPQGFYLCHSLPHKNSNWQKAISIMQNTRKAQLPLLKHYLRFCDENNAIEAFYVAGMPEKGYEVPLLKASPAEARDYVLVKKELENWTNKKTELEEKIKKLDDDFDKNAAKELTAMFDSYNWKSAELPEEWAEIKKLADAGNSRALKKINEILEAFALKIKEEYSALTQSLDCFVEKINDKNALKDEYIGNLLNKFIESAINGKESKTENKNDPKNNPKSASEQMLDQNIDFVLKKIMEEINEKENSLFKVNDEVIVSKITYPHKNCDYPNQCENSRYMYGPNAYAVRLNSKGKIVLIETPERIYARIGSYDYMFHPSELSPANPSKKNKKTTIESLLESMYQSREDSKKETESDKKIGVADILEMAREEVLIKKEAEQKGIDPEFLFGVYGFKPGAFEKAKEKLPEFIIKKVREKQENLAGNFRTAVKNDLAKKYGLKGDEEWACFSAGRSSDFFEKYKKNIIDKNNFELQKNKTELADLNQTIKEAKNYIESFE